jgi:hypothetical protein
MVRTAGTFQVLADRVVPGRVLYGDLRHHTAFARWRPYPNAGVQPWTLFNDFRIARRVYFNERISLDLITDMFNLVNKFNVASVNQLWTNAGRRLII